MNAQEGAVRWTLCLDVSIEGIELPFRLRFATDDHDRMLEALSDFWAMIVDKVQELPE